MLAMTTIRPRRSVLYMPGSNARALEKARSIPADAFIFDLEDAVAPEVKELARRQVRDAVKGGGFGEAERVVRVNALATPWGRDDAAAMAASGADAILLPKVESAADVRALADLLAAAGGSGIPIWCMVETPKGVLRAEEIAAAPGVAVLVMGTSDLTKDLHARHTVARAPMLTSLGLCLLAARAFGRDIVDGVHLDLADDDGFEAACRQGVELGFDGKTLIHPRQVDACNRLFAPSPAEVAEARKIIAAFEAARRDGQGVTVVDGKLIEALHVENARRLAALGEAIARRAQVAV
jgi:citrate lyase subunit beta / citryl-CoA lyase